MSGVAACSGRRVQASQLFQIYSGRYGRHEESHLDKEAGSSAAF